MTQRSPVHGPSHPAPGSAETITVLSVSPTQEDHRALARLLCRDNWRVQPAQSVAAAVQLLRSHRIPVVVCNSDSIPEIWKELLEQIRELAAPPSVIVASRLADEYLWAEALNLGAYDVLAKPLVAIEVTGILTLAWLRWRNEHERRLAAGICA
ncbi:MAG TPA: response regulator [Bryobacteraceae bacterium]|nr:response regulator [Bryobacteraceae bacterium]